MGTDWEDCQIVAELIGTKTFINEFVAYERLSEYIDNRETGAGPTLSVSVYLMIASYFIRQGVIIHRKCLSNIQNDIQNVISETLA